MKGIFGNVYKLKKSENFDSFLQYIEVGYFYYKRGVQVSPVVWLVQNADGTYTFTMHTTMRTTITTFRLGEEFIEERADGVKVRSKITFEGNTMIQTQVERNGRRSTHVREFTPNNVFVTTTADTWDSKCVRMYERVDGQYSGMYYE